MRTILSILFAAWCLCGQSQDLADPAFLASLDAPAAGGGGPTLVDQDNFDSYGDTTSLDDAANWVVESGTLSVNKPASDGSIFSGAAVVGLARHTATFAANQRSEVTLDSVTASGSFEWTGAAVRIQTGAATAYLVVAGAADLYLLSVNAGTVATVNSDTGMSLSAGHKIAIEASGSGTSTRLKVQIDTGSGWVDKWTDQNPAVDIDGGAAGVGSWLFTNPSSRVDDWKGYDL